mmetsp:Transcript_1724/g.3485  ORF Transcript_1724/g.3485 Transcript_1724/m.3485 type:complete len:212 (-) Transcript_1724:849-1484(-)
MPPYEARTGEEDCAPKPPCCRASNSAAAALRTMRRAFARDSGQGGDAVRQLRTVAARAGVMADVSAGKVPTSWTLTTRVRMRSAVSASGEDRPRSASNTTPNALRSPRRAATPSEVCTSASAAPRDWLPPLATTLTVAAIPCSPPTSREARTPRVCDARTPPFCEARTPDGALCCVFCTPPGAFRAFLEASFLLKGFSFSNGSGLGSCTKG